MRKHAEIVAPLTNLLHQDAAGDWTSQRHQDQPFSSSNVHYHQAMSLLTPPSHSRSRRTQHTMQMGQFLSQNGTYIAFEWRKLSPAEGKHAVHEKELLALVHAHKANHVHLD